MKHRLQISYQPSYCVRPQWEEKTREESIEQTRRPFFHLRKERERERLPLLVDTGPSVKTEGGERLFKGCERGFWWMRRERRWEGRRHGPGDQKRHSRKNGPSEISEQLISSSRFTVSLPQPTKWVTRGRVPFLTQPTDPLNICIKVRALPGRPPSIFSFHLTAFWLRRSRVDGGGRDEW